MAEGLDSSSDSEHVELSSGENSESDQEIDIEGVQPYQFEPLESDSSTESEPVNHHGDGEPQDRNERLHNTNW